MIADAFLADCKRADPYTLERKTKKENFDKLAHKSFCQEKLFSIMLASATPYCYHGTSIVDSGQKLAQLIVSILWTLFNSKSYKMTKLHSISIGAFYYCDYLALVPASALELSSMF